jgi:hypothetical protein
MNMHDTLCRTGRLLTTLILVALLTGCGVMVSIPRADAPVAEAAVGPKAFGVEVLPRDAWAEQPPGEGMRPHTISRIAVHHTAWRQNPEATLTEKMRSLERFSRSRAELAPGRYKEPWPDVPYHWFIDLEGRVAEGRDVRYAGDTNTPYDPAGFLHIVLEGNFEEEQPTAAQLEALGRMLRWGTTRFDVPPDEITGHRDHVATLCPGEALYGLLPELREALRD